MPLSSFPRAPLLLIMETLWTLVVKGIPVLLTSAQGSSSDLGKGSESPPPRPRPPFRKTHLEGLLSGSGNDAWHAIGIPESSGTLEKGEKTCYSISLVWDAADQSSQPQVRISLPVADGLWPSLCSFACYLFHHFCSIINTERLFFIETMLPKGFVLFFLTSSPGFSIFLLSQHLKHV